MAPITIKEVKTDKELQEFIDFPEKLYKDNPYYVPQLNFDQIDTLSPRRNPAYEFCDAALYIAYRGKESVGRVAAIVNRKANEQWNHQEVRFGWLDFVDDKEVSAALIAKVEDFGRERGMDKIVGPLGFTDLDPEGMLIAGYDRLSTMATLYNFPYYADHMDSLGFEKDADWQEYKVTVPEKVPEKYVRVAEIVRKRENLHVRKLTRRIIRKENYGRKLFHLICECYKDLYNYTVLPDDLADKYIGFYLTILDLDYLTMIENEKNEIVAFGISMPSLASALIKSRGKMLPFGWWHLAKSLFFKHDEGIELLLVGVRPDYRNRGVNALIFEELCQIFIDKGAKWAETNAILEDNLACQALWQYFDTECVKRRRAYIKAL